MPTSLRDWAIWGAVQAVLTFAFKLIIRLADNALMGWGDDKIAAHFGITSPDLQTAFAWAVPFALAALAVWGLHIFYTRFHLSSKAASGRQVEQDEAPLSLREQNTAALAAMG